MAGKFFCTAGDKWCKFLRKGTCGYCKSPVGEMTKCPRIAKIETKCFGDILREVSFDNVFARLADLYPDQMKNKDSYQDVFNNLLSRRVKEKHTLSELFIRVETINGSINVCGVHPGQSRRFGIEFVPWNEWLTTFVTKDTLDAFSNEDIVAACLYEMTFFGFEEKSVRKHKQRIVNNITELINQENSKKN